MSLSMLRKWAASSRAAASPTKRMPKAKITRAKGPFLAGFHSRHQILDGFLAHPGQLLQLFRDPGNTGLKGL